MKRTLFVLTTVATLILMSCNHIDNSNPLSEELNLPQTQELTPENIFQIDGVQYEELTEISPINEEQIQVLKKSSIDLELSSSIDLDQPTTRASGSKTITCPGTMMISNVSYGSTVQSNEITCDFTSLPSSSKNTKYEFKNSAVLGSNYFVGATGDFRWKLRCGDYYTLISWGGTPITVQTEAFKGLPANVKCYLSFISKCVATGTGGVGCKETWKNDSMTNYYSY